MPLLHRVDMICMPIIDNTYKLGLNVASFLKFTQDYSIKPRQELHVSKHYSNDADLRNRLCKTLINFQKALMLGVAIIM